MLGFKKAKKSGLGWSLNMYDIGRGLELNTDKWVANQRFYNANPQKARSYVFRMRKLAEDKKDYIPNLCTCAHLLSDIIPCNCRLLKNGWLFRELFNAVHSTQRELNESHRVWNTTPSKRQGLVLGYSNISDSDKELMPEGFKNKNLANLLVQLTSLSPPLISQCVHWSRMVSLLHPEGKIVKGFYGFEDEQYHSEYIESEYSVRKKIVDNEIYIPGKSSHHHAIRFRKTRRKDIWNKLLFHSWNRLSGYNFDVMRDNLYRAGSFKEDDYLVKYWRVIETNPQPGITAVLEQLNSNSNNYWDRRRELALHYLVFFYFHDMNWDQEYLNALRVYGKDEIPEPNDRRLGSGMCETWLEATHRNFRHMNEKYVSQANTNASIHCNTMIYLLNEFFSQFFAQGAVGLVGSKGKGKAGMKAKSRNKLAKRSRARNRKKKK